jgi:hypothetical protein
MKQLLTFFLVIFWLVSGWSQCEESIHAAEVSLGKSYIANPQFNSGIVSAGDSLIFESVWLANNTYRIATSAGEQEQIDIRLFDQNNNLIFSGSEFNYPTKWDFFIENSMTVRCVVRPIQLSATPYCLTVLTGFKK